MSGSSWDYVYRHIEAAAERLDPKPEAVPRERRALGQLMRLVAKAMHDIEWVDSCDMSPGDELPAIRAALAPSKPLAAPPKPMGAEERSKRLHSDLSFASFGADQRAMIEGAIREADSAAFNRGVVHSACYARDRFGENHILVADILALKDKCFVVRP